SARSRSPSFCSSRAVSGAPVAAGAFPTSCRSAMSRRRRTDRRAPRAARRRGRRRRLRSADDGATVVVPDERRNGRVPEPGSRVVPAGRSSPNRLGAIGPVGEAGADNLARLASEQVLRQDREHPPGVALIDDADPLRHDVDETEDVAGREIIERQRGLAGSTLDARQLQDQKPRNYARDSNVCVAFNLHLVTEAETWRAGSALARAPVWRGRLAPGHRAAMQFAAFRARAILCK